MDKIIFGSLVLHAERAVPPIDIPLLKGLPQKIGSHVNGRFNGSWLEVTNVDVTESYLPQRFKRLSIAVTNDDARVPLIGGLEELDAMYPEARQLYKLNRLLLSLDSQNHSFASVVNIASAVQDENLVSGSFYLLSLGQPIYLSLVFDVEENSVQLMWATFDFKANIQSRGLFRYVFLSLGVVQDRPVFVHTQNLCARWWRLVKNFGEGRHGLLTAGNSLELMLFKDPNIEHGSARD